MIDRRGLQRMRNKTSSPLFFLQSQLFMVSHSMTVHITVRTSLSVQGMFVYSVQFNFLLPQQLLICRHGASADLQAATQLGGQVWMASVDVVSLAHNHSVFRNAQGRVQGIREDPAQRNGGDDGEWQQWLAQEVLDYWPLMEFWRHDGVHDPHK